MQKILICTKKLISICLVTLLLFVSTLTISPAPALAAGDVVILKCESDCTAAFTVGAITGSAVTVVATGSGAELAAGVGITAIVDTAVAAVPLAIAATPFLVPAAIGTAAIGGSYLIWQQFSQPSTH